VKIAQFGVLTVGSAETNNSLNTEANGEGYEGINEVIEMGNQENR
jgi:hypothetical protein